MLQTNDNLGGCTASLFVGLGIQFHMLLFEVFIDLLLMYYVTSSGSAIFCAILSVNFKGLFLSCIEWKEKWMMEQGYKFLFFLKDEIFELHKPNMINKA